MHTTVFQGVDPHSLLTLAHNQHPPNNSTPERSIQGHISPQSDEIPPPTLCDTVITLHPNGERSRKLFIRQPEIARRVYGLLQNKDKGELWDTAHALRDLRREYLTAGTPLLQCVGLILRDIDHAIRSEIEDFAQCGFTDEDCHNTITAWGCNSQIFYSIVMLSYGLEATLSQDGSSHSVRVEDVILSTRGEVILIFYYA